MTTLIWLEDDGGGALQKDSAIDGTGWPANAHIKLAKVTMASGVITLIEDVRTILQGGDPVLRSVTDGTRGTGDTAGQVVWNTGDNAPNYWDGSAWRDAAGVVT